jgi:hypothetical protein
MYVAWALGNRKHDTMPNVNDHPRPPEKEDAPPNHDEGLKRNKQCQHARLVTGDESRGELPHSHLSYRTEVPHRPQQGGNAGRTTAHKRRHLPNRRWQPQNEHKRRRYPQEATRIQGEQAHLSPTHTLHTESRCHVAHSDVATKR